jgi:hypothetical protein
MMAISRPPGVCGTLPLIFHTDTVESMLPQTMKVSPRQDNSTFDYDYDFDGQEHNKITASAGNIHDNTDNASDSRQRCRNVESRDIEAGRHIAVPVHDEPSASCVRVPHAKLPQVLDAIQDTGARCAVQETTASPLTLPISEKPPSHFPGMANMLCLWMYVKLLPTTLSGNLYSALPSPSRPPSPPPRGVRVQGKSSCM